MKKNELVTDIMAVINWLCGQNNKELNITFTM